MDVFLGLLFIFVARVTDVSLATTRMLMVVKGKKALAASIGFFEVLVYILALNKVMQTLDNPVNLIVYCLGFSVGNIVGISIEDKLAMGYLTAQVITLENPLELSDKLREEGFGVTVTIGQGREGERYILEIMLLRKRMPRLQKIIDNWDKKAFMVVLDARATKGGTAVYKR
ncbi:DUF2179 domain-containing protein [Desulfonispora thiosulfatigenes]|nr:DUF2179 domain-containing protein [Desulfonispora thiosulfatigenes]